MPVAAIRGAITLAENTRDEVLASTQELVRTLFEKNSLDMEDVICVMFTATPDVTAEFPALAVREMGIVDIPLLCAQEISIESSISLCIRVLVQVETDRPRRSFAPVYLRKAASLRPDLARE